MTLLQKYNRGDTLTDKELLDLEQNLQAWCLKPMMNLSEDEESLFKFAAFFKLQSVRDIIKARKEKYL